MTEDTQLPEDNTIPLTDEEQKLPKEILKARKWGIVTNYPNACPFCQNTVIHPAIPVGEESTIQSGVVYFQCMNTQCTQQFAVKLTKTGEEKHLFFLFAPGKPMAIVMLEGGQAQALKEDIADRYRSEWICDGKDPEDIMLYVATLQELMDSENAAPWIDFLKETTKFTEAPQYDFQPNVGGKLASKPGFLKILEEGKEAITDPKIDPDDDFKPLSEVIRDAQESKETENKDSSE